MKISFFQVPNKDLFIFLCQKANFGMKNRNKFFETIETANTTGIEYIGTGNPDANILIVGKESSLEKNDPHIYFLENNLSLWKRDKELDIHQIGKWDGIIGEKSNFSPMFPYNGQLFKNSPTNGGTSKTWYNYQKIANQVFGTSETINFHENIFTTEANSSPSRKTENADTHSVVSRKGFISKSKFFQDFQVVIIDGVGYFEITDKNNEIEDIFGVKFIKNIGIKSQPIWIHKGVNSSKLVINTYQLGGQVTDERLKKIGHLVSLYLKDKDKAFMSLNND
ncbi:MAG: hypothetical protein R2779_05730 [Crocinitomicaceae bacterium]